MEDIKNYRKDYSHEGLGGIGDNKESFGWQEGMFSIGSVSLILGLVGMVMLYISVFSN